MTAAKRTHSRLFCGALAASVISSLSILAMLSSAGQGGMIAFAAVFWVGLALEQVFFWKANRIMKAAAAKSRRKIRGSVGILSFAKSLEGLIADGVFLLALLAFLLCSWLAPESTGIQYIFICLLVLTFRLHCFLNGRNFRYKKQTERKADQKDE